jgi:tetratricopeptide (TPR) repeat protein
VEKRKSQQTTLLRFYHKYLCEEDTAQFITEVSARYDVSTLGSLARRGGRLHRRAAIFAIGFLGDFSLNDVMGAALSDSDRGVRMLADHGIRSLWMRQCGSPASHALARIIRLNSCERFEDAEFSSSELIQSHPDFAEAWNQLSIARHNQADWYGSLDDCSVALELNPYHFEAAIGAGSCYLALDSPEDALASFQQAIRIHPGLEAIRVRVKQLQQALEEL